MFLLLLVSRIGNVARASGTLQGYYEPDGSKDRRRIKCRNNVRYEGTKPPEIGEQRGRSAIRTEQVAICGMITHPRCCMRRSRLRSMSGILVRRCTRLTARA